ncbi:MAG: M48 family metallopeptidase [Tepidimonas sp.]|uniref:M48 family metallopeptidase n=1 Tax=Tepidimonas sp. TaxID=2002775 RepID=UPI00259D7A95|nr:M48 family metallopeptidase [Tepidimonas sp.]MDM7457152.1 M48 family metallopeptidase [Tepidimonas sp.]
MMPPATGTPTESPAWVHPRANRAVELNGVHIAYECRRSARRTIGLSVGPLGLSVRAPRWATWSDIEGFLQVKAAWVLAHLQRQACRPQPVWPEPTPALRERARALFAARVAHYAPLLAVRPAALRLSSARTRWGSASARGTVSLNWRLVCLPVELLDYVVVHELAHLREMHHGPAFWAVVAAVLPDYAERRAALRRYVLG